MCKLGSFAPSAHAGIVSRSLKWEWARSEVSRAEPVMSWLTAGVTQSRLPTPNVCKPSSLLEPSCARIPSTF